MSFFSKVIEQNHLGKRKLIYFISNQSCFEAGIPKMLLKAKKLEKVLESLKQLPQVHKKQQFDLFGETKTTLGGKRLFSIVLIKNIL